MIREEHRWGYVILTIDRPERMNAMSFDVMVPLRETLDRIRADNETRVVVIGDDHHPARLGVLVR